MSFLQKFTGKKTTKSDSSSVSSTKAVTEKVAQLFVDVYQTDEMIVVYAQSAGADMNDVQVSIEGEGKIILIEGTRIRPELLVSSQKTTNGSFVAQECVWGNFYRRIILPQKVNTELAEAKITNGVLMLTLPFITLDTAPKVQLKVNGQRPPAASAAKI